MTDNFRERLTDFIPPVLLWIVFLVIILIFIVVSVALTYHWKNYNVDSKVVRRIKRVYFWVSGVFLLAMLVGVISYWL